MRNSKIGLTIVLIITILVASTFSVAAYSLHSWKLTNEISAFIPDSQLGSMTLQHMGSSFSIWNGEIGVSYMGLNNSATHTETLFPINDSRNLVYKIKDGVQEYKGATRVFASNNNVIGADINLNQHWEWANSAQVGKMDAFTIFLHEVGHVAGINHSGLTTAVMYSDPPTNYTLRQLSLDDKTAVYVKYI